MREYPRFNLICVADATGKTPSQVLCGASLKRPVEWFIGDTQKSFFERMVRPEDV